jgi:hypothetical protein
MLTYTRLVILGAITFSLVGCEDARIGNVRVNTGNPYLDIGGVVFIVLVVALGVALIRRFITKAPPNSK